MPTYSTKCKDCGKESDRYCAISANEGEAVGFCECGGVLIKKYGSSVNVIKGGDTPKHFHTGDK